MVPQELSDNKTKSEKYRFEILKKSNETANVALLYNKQVNLIIHRWYRVVCIFKDVVKQIKLANFKYCMIYKINHLHLHNKNTCSIVRYGSVQFLRVTVVMCVVSPCVVFGVWAGCVLYVIAMCVMRTVFVVIGCVK